MHSRQGIGQASVVVRIARAIEQRTDRLFVGGTAPGKPVDHHARGLSHGLWRSNWHG